MSKKQNSIHFQIVYSNAHPGSYGSKEDPSPYVSLTKKGLTGSIGEMLNKHDIVIDKSEIRVVFDYPFAEPHIIKLVPLFGDKNFTRVGLAKAIAIKYQQIYEEEKMTTQLPIESMEERSKRYGGVCKLQNRAQTNGNWGIWGHSLDELDLHTIFYDEKRDLYRLYIDS